MPADDLTLREAIVKLHYGAECRACKEVRHVNLRRVATACGLDFKVRDVRSRLRCSKCGNRDVIVTTLWRDATTADQMIAGWLGSE